MKAQLTALCDHIHDCLATQRARFPEETAREEALFTKQRRFFQVELDILREEYPDLFADLPCFFAFAEASEVIGWTEMAVVPRQGKKVSCRRFYSILEPDLAQADQTAEDIQRRVIAKVCEVETDLAPLTPIETWLRFCHHGNCSQSLVLHEHFAFALLVEFLLQAFLHHA